MENTFLNMLFISMLSGIFLYIIAKYLFKEHKIIAFASLLIWMWYIYKVDSVNAYLTLEENQGRVISFENFSKAEIDSDITILCVFEDSTAIIFLNDNDGKHKHFVDMKSVMPAFDGVGEYDIVSCYGYNSIESLREKLKLWYRWNPHSIDTISLLVVRE
ncbi:MAG: hypothetical protein ACI9AR_000139 [Flavobacteriaceae bacterium]|jgi:hypothetical protein